MSYLLRKSLDSDAGEIAKLIVQSWNETYQNILPAQTLKELDWNNFSSKRKEFIYQSSSRQSWVVVDNNKIVGFCDFGPIRSEQKSPLGEIYAIYVLKEYQNHGIGSALFRQAVCSLKELGYHKFIIWVLEQNALAVNFYKKNKGVGTAKKVRLFDTIPYNMLQHTFVI